MSKRYRYDDDNTDGEDSPAGIVVILVMLAALLVLTVFIRGNGS